MNDESGGFDESTLTLSASGPAIVETRTTDDGVKITETRETELSASFEIDAAELDMVGDVYRAGPCQQRHRRDASKSAL